MKQWVGVAAALIMLVTWRVSAQEMPQVYPTASPAAGTEYGVEGYPTSPPTLVEALGRTKTQAYCSVCHSTTYITMQPPLPRKTWDAEVHKMIKVHGADIPESDAQGIIDYLAAHYSPETISATYATQLERGRSVYNRVCNACHQPDGQGLPQTFPPLEPRIRVLAPTAGGRRYLMHAVLFGLSGPIEINSRPSIGAMPAWGRILSDDDIASVLTYVSSRWSPQPVLFNAATVSKERQHHLSSEQVLAERRKLGGR